MCFFTILQFDGETSQFTSPFFVGHLVVEREREISISVLHKHPMNGLLVTISIGHF